MIDFVMKKKKKHDGLLTIIWISIPIQPKLSSKVRHLRRKDQTIGFFQSRWWISMASRPSAIM